MTKMKAITSFREWKIVEFSNGYLDLHREEEILEIQGRY
jgi:hypothetical protein